MKGVVTPVFRVSFPHIFKPQKDDKGQESYSLVALFEKDSDLKELKAVITSAVVEKWGADKSKWPKNLTNPLKDQGEKISSKTNKPFNGYVEGNLCCTMKTKNPVVVVGPDPRMPLTEQDFYAGCYARAYVVAKAYSYLGKNGVTLYLNQLQKVKDGASLMGGVKAEDVFSQVGDSNFSNDSESAFE